jgi:hypothetical protein
MTGRPSPTPRHTSFRFVGWLAVLAMVALSVISPVSVAANGNNGTIKIHEQGTPAGTESNDPKVCIFNVEGFKFDSGQSGYIRFDVQGGDSPHGTASGPFGWGPANAQGRYDTEYYTLKPGHYKATLYGKKVGRNGQTQIDVKAKSKVFKVECKATTPTPTPTPETHATPTPTPETHATPTPTPETHATPTPTPETHATPTPTPKPTPTPGGGEQGATPTPTPTPGGGVSGATGTPTVHVTLPPTDTDLSAAGPEGSDGWRIVLLGLAALLAAVLVVTPARGSIRRR